MKVDGGATTTSAVLPKTKLKDEGKESFLQPLQNQSQNLNQQQVTSTSAVGVGGVTTLTISANYNESAVKSNDASAAAATVAADKPDVLNKNAEPFPVELDVKPKGKGMAVSREKPTREESSVDARSSSSSSPSSSPGSQFAQQLGNGSRVEYSYKSQMRSSSRSPDNEDSPLSSTLQSFKTENVGDDATGSRGPQEDSSAKNGEGLSNGGNAGGRCISGIFAGHGKLRRLLGTLVQFAMDISADTGDTVRTLVLGLLSSAMSAEEFHSALQEATNFPLREFVLPYLKHTLPSLRKDLSVAARADNQTCVQYLRSNESAVLEAVGLAPSGETVEVFGDHVVIGSGGSGASGAQANPSQYGVRSSSNSGTPGAQSHGSGTSSNVQHYSTSAHAAKRRASDTPYYENGALLEDAPVYGKRSNSSWNHHHQHLQPHLADSSSYCWYHPLHSSGGSIQNHPHSHGHGSNAVIPSLVQINQSGSFGTPHLPHQPSISHGTTPSQNGVSSHDDEWKSIHVMLNCILGMVEKTKRALAILQRRGCSSPAAAAPPSNHAANHATPSNGNVTGSASANGAASESTGDREGTLKRLSGEIVAQTIRATEDRVAEVRRKAEEAVQEVKRAAVAEVQRAVAVAVAESRASERLRAHRYLDLSQRNHGGSLRPSPFLRVAFNGNTTPDTTTRTSTTTTTSSMSLTSAPLNEDEKDVHLAITGSSCWNCGRPALETCGGCGIARYCGSFCQHRDWEAGGHHANCNNSAQQQDRGRSSSPTPTGTGRSSTIGNAADSDGKSSQAVSTSLVKGK